MQPQVRLSPSIQELVWFVVLMIPAYLEVSLNGVRAVKTVASGGLGDIYLGDLVDLNLVRRNNGDSRCVIKVLKEHASSNNNKNTLTVFTQEIAVMNYLASHPNIAKFLGYTTVPKSIIMRFYPLSSLDAFIKNGIQGIPYQLDVVFNIMHGVGNGLRYIHTKQIAHRDLKPANILLEPMHHGSYLLRPLLTDFGISCILNPQSLAVHAFVPIQINGMSVRYAAPEQLRQFRGTNVSTDPVTVSRSDVYAFAVVVYELLTRKQPWAS